MRAHLLFGAAAIATALTLAACSGSSGGHPSTPLPTSRAGGGATTPVTVPTGATTTASTGATSQVTERFVDMYTNSGKPGPAIDIYDTPPGQRATPLLKDVAYGTVTAYVHPHLEQNTPNIISLYALPTGEDPVAKQADEQGLGGVQDDGSHPQLTAVLTGEEDPGLSQPLAGLSFGQRVEKGSDNGTKAPVAPPAPAGKGEFLADASQLTNAVPGSHQEYLMINSLCDSPANGDPNRPGLPEIFAADGKAPVSSFAVFPEAPGSYTVAVSTTTISENLTCKDLTERLSSTAFTLAAGQQVEAYVYGTSDTDLHLLLAPIQP
jgi:hypothetical protein